MDKWRWVREGVSRFSIGNFFSQLPKKLTGAPFCAVFQKIPVAKKFIDKKGGGREAVSRCSVESFISQISRKRRRGTRLYFVSEKIR